MKRLIVTVLLSIFIFPFTIKAQSPLHPDSLLDKMIGKWVLRGTIDGQETVHDVVATRVLNGQYLQFKETSREKDTKGNPAYEAEVYICWQEKPKQYFCLWLDNTSNEGISNQVIGKAKPSGEKIAFVFTYSNGTHFYTTFLYNSLTNSWQWTMDGEEKGKLQPFARVKLTKE